jgi:hypothetical protein
MAIKVKITPMGGYVLGDGKCPFDPDQFLIAFGSKILEAQRQGLEMLEIDPVEVEAYIARAKRNFAGMVQETPVREVTRKEAARLLE